LKPVIPRQNFPHKKFHIKKPKKNFTKHHSGLDSAWRGRITSKQNFKKTIVLLDFQRSLADGPPRRLQLGFSGLLHCKKAGTFFKQGLIVCMLNRSRPSAPHVVWKPRQKNAGRLSHKFFTIFQGMPKNRAPHGLQSMRSGAKSCRGQKLGLKPCFCHAISSLFTMTWLQNPCAAWHFVPLWEKVHDAKVE
jgi:hypothetical protein